MSESMSAESFISAMRACLPQARMKRVAGYLGDIKRAVESEDLPVLFRLTADLRSVDAAYKDALVELEAAVHLRGVSDGAIYDFERYMTRDARIGPSGAAGREVLVTLVTVAHEYLEAREDWA